MADFFTVFRSNFQIIIGKVNLIWGKFVDHGKGGMKNGFRA